MQMGVRMIIKTKAFDEISIDEDKIIRFENGIIGFPELKDFALVHDMEKTDGTLSWMISIQEPAFAMPVIDPLAVKNTYNPKVEEELLKSIGELNPEEMLVLVTLTVPSDITKMSINLRAPIIINATEKKACQIIIDGEEYSVKFPVYDLLKASKEKAGE